jgi:hypothetical protein
MGSAGCPRKWQFSGDQSTKRTSQRTNIFFEEAVTACSVWLCHEVGRWVGFLFIRIGWTHPTAANSNSNTSSSLCSRIQESNIISNSELIDLVDPQASEQAPLRQPDVHELGGCIKISISEVIDDASRNKTDGLVARRSRDSSSAIDLLSSSQKLEQIALLECRIGDDDVMNISKAIASGCAKLKSLAMPQNLITCSGVRHLATGLLIHGRVQRLDLSFNRCGDDGAEYLAFLVLNSKAMRVLQLRENGILSTGAIALANALIQRQVNRPRTLPSSLDELDLSCNKIGDSGAEAFSAVLRLDCALRILDVSYNSITVVGARKLSRAAEGHRTLERLLVRSVARSNGEQSELTALQLRHRAVSQR